ncbi:MAG: DeoR/GlpR family DNA-binding transcription regulator [Lachnospiraceae bacterium]|nr:DeoR/GlpR family DNA-binding transcription regulator [Lachnospiraceae bacterium]
MLAIERRNEILEKLQMEKRVIVSELSLQYGVSEETIRRDLDKLEKEGYATKSYGGAVINENMSIDLPFNIRKNQNVHGKQIIAGLAASLVENGDHIILDASSTAVFVAKALKESKERLTVITNSMEVLLTLSDAPEWEIICTGGVMDERYLTFLGTDAESSIRAHYADKVIFSCKAFSRGQGFMESKDSLAGIKKTMLSSGRTRILVADSSKFDRSAFSVVSDLRDVDVVVTDQRPSEEWMEHFSHAGVSCVFPGIDSENGPASRPKPTDVMDTDAF